MRAVMILIAVAAATLFALPGRIAIARPASANVDCRVQVSPEPPFTRGTTNTIQWVGVPEDCWAWDLAHRQYILKVTDNTTGQSRRSSVDWAYWPSTSYSPDPPISYAHSFQPRDFPGGGAADGHSYSYVIWNYQLYCPDYVGVTTVCKTKRKVKAGPPSDPVSSVQDAMPPALTAVTVAGGAPYTNSRLVDVQLTAVDPGADASGVALAQVSTDGSFACLQRLSICSTAIGDPLKVQVASGPDGPRTVFARVFDDARSSTGSPGPPNVFGPPGGNASNVVSATFVLDTIGPTPLVSHKPDPVKAGALVTFDASASMDHGGFGADSGLDAGTATWHFGDGAAASGLVVSHPYSKAGAHTATFSVRDRAGNLSTLDLPVTIMAPDWGGTGTTTKTNGTPTQSTPTADVTPPQLSTVSARLRGRRLALRLTLSEPATVLIQVVRVRPRPTTAAGALQRDAQAGRSTFALTLRRVHARYRVLVAARDGAGNVSPTRVLMVGSPRKPTR